MISVAVKGFGIVIWDGADTFRTFGPSDTLTAMLWSRVELALAAVDEPSAEAVRTALLGITGAHLLAEDCDHGPGICDYEIGLN